MVWYKHQLIVSNRDFLFYDVDSQGGLKLARNISMVAIRIKMDELCIKIDEFCIKIDEFLY